MTDRLGLETRAIEWARPLGREQTTGLATEAGRDVGQTLGRPRKILHQSHQL